MTDSLQVNVDSVYNVKIDSLLSSTKHIREFTDYQMKPHEPSDWRLITIVFLIALIPIILWVIQTIKNYRKNGNLPIFLSKEYRGNFIWFFGWVWFFAFFFFALYLAGKIHTPKLGFTVSHFDFILALATLLAIGGAIWAVYARIDAERAFHKSQETLDALGNSFDFSKILDKDKIPAMFFQVKRDETLEDIDISLYLGFPAIGYLYNKKDKFKHSTPEDVFLTFRDFIKGVNHLISKDMVKGLTFQVCIFSKQKSYEILKAKEGLESISLPNNPDDNILESFYKELEILKKRQKDFDEHGKPKRCPKTQNLIIINMGRTEKNSNNEEVFVEDFNDSEKFRFVIFQHKKRNSLPTKSIVWVVPDINNTNGFESSAFQTNDDKFIQVLESVFTT